MTIDHPVYPLSGPALSPRKGRDALHLIIFLHGIGANGDDLIQLAPLFQQFLPASHCVAPDAPFACDMAPDGRMWFSIADLQQVSRLDGARHAAPSLHHFIDQQLRRLGLSDDKLLLVGFSQGAMMALHVGLRRQAAPAGIVSHSGMILGRETLDRELTCAPPVLLTHGVDDMVLPIACLAELDEALSQLGISHETHRMPGVGHGLDQQTVTLALRFAMRVLGVS